MASVPRDFVADEPVLVTTRCALRVKFMQHRAMKTEIKRQIAKWAPECAVVVYGFTLAANHIHLLIAQGFTGQDRRRKRGISAFCRNVLSAIARYGNALHSSQGRFLERAFRSRRRPSAEQALQSLGYILEHPVKHGIEGGFEDPNTSGRVYRRGMPDGVATAVLGVFLLRDPELRWNAILNLFEEMYADARWREEGVEVAREILRRHPEVVDQKAWSTPISVALWAGEEAAKRAREAVLSAPQFRVKYNGRNAPAPGDVITVVFEEIPAPPSLPAFSMDSS